MGLWGGTWSGPATPSGYASVLIPLFKYYSELITVGSTNNTITFGEGGSALTATVASGTWSWGELAWKVKVALEAAGTGTYTVTYTHSARKFTIAKSTGTFTLDVGGNANDLLDDMGFTSDKAGALTYTSDTSVPAQTTLTCTQRARGPQLESDATREDTDIESGRRESTFYGEVERYTFRLEFESVAVAQGIYDMWRGAGRYGNAIDFYPDSTDTTNFVTVLWDAKSHGLREMTDRGLFRLYEVEFRLRIKNPTGSSTIKGRDFLDRRPSS